jgi:hypothetical protein
MRHALIVQMSTYIRLAIEVLLIVVSDTCLIKSLLVHVHSLVQPGVPHFAVNDLRSVSGDGKCSCDVYLMQFIDTDSQDDW